MRNVEFWHDLSLVLPQHHLSKISEESSKMNNLQRTTRLACRRTLRSSSAVPRAQVGIQKPLVPTLLLSTLQQLGLHLRPVNPIITRQPRKLLVTSGSRLERNSKDKNDTSSIASGTKAWGRIDFAGFGYNPLAYLDYLLFRAALVVIAAAIIWLCYKKWQWNKWIGLRWKPWTSALLQENISSLKEKLSLPPLNEWLVKMGKPNAENNVQKPDSPISGQSSDDNPPSGNMLSAANEKISTWLRRKK